MFQRLVNKVDIKKLENKNLPEGQVKKIGIIIFLIMLFSYCYFAQPFSNDNSVSRISLVIAIIEDGTVKIDKFHQATHDKSFFAGHYYSDKAPGLSLTALPFTAATHRVLRFFYSDITWMKIDNGKNRPTLTTKFKFITYMSTIFTSGLVAAIAVTVLYFVALRMGASILGAIFAALTFGLATPAWGWATAFFGHALTGSCLFLAFAAIYYMQRSHPKKWRDTLLGFLTGALLSWAIVVEYPSLISAIIIAAFGVTTIIHWERKRKSQVLISAIVGGAIFIVPLLVYNALAFGSSFHLGYQHVLPRFDGMKQGIFGISYPKFTVLCKILFSPYRGLFWFSPILIVIPLALYQSFRLPKLRNITLIFTLITVYYLMLNSAYYYWDGGWSTGPRHVTPMLPFVCLPIAILWTKADIKIRAVLLGLFGFSFIISLICVSVSMESPSKYANPLFAYLIPKFIAGRIRSILNLFFYKQSGHLALIPPLMVLGFGVFYIGRILRLAELKID